MIKKKKNKVKNCEAFSTFSWTGSNVGIVSVKLKLSLPTRKALREEVHDWSILCIRDTRDQDNSEVKNKYEALRMENESETEA